MSAEIGEAQAPAPGREKPTLKAIFAWALGSQ